MCERCWGERRARSEGVSREKRCQIASGERELIALRRREMAGGLGLGWRYALSVVSAVGPAAGGDGDAQDNAGFRRGIFGKEIISHMEALPSPGAPLACASAAWLEDETRRFSIRPRVPAGHTGRFRQARCTGRERTAFIGGRPIALSRMSGRVLSSSGYINCRLRPGG